MKRFILVSGILSILLLSACANGSSNSVSVQENKQAAQSPIKEEAKKETLPVVKQSSNEQVKTLPDGIIEKTVNGVTTYSDDPYFKYFYTAHWSDDYKGLKTEIEKVAIADKYKIENGKTATVVGVTWKITNITQGKFTTYPSQAVLVTSSGEQIDSPIAIEKHMDGEIDKGVMKEGKVSYKLERGNGDKITWIKLKWNTRQGPEDKIDTPIKRYEIELKIPQ